MASLTSPIGRACGDKPKAEDVEGSSRESSKKFGKQPSEANARTGNWLVDQVNKGADNYNLKYSETDPWELSAPLFWPSNIDEGADNYNRNYSETDPWELPAPTFPLCNIPEHSPFYIPPGNIQERSLLETGEYNHNCDLMYLDSTTPLSADAPQMPTLNPSALPEHSQFLEPDLTPTAWSVFEPSKMSETQSKTSSPLQRRLRSIGSTSATPYSRGKRIGRVPKGTKEVNPCASCRRIKTKCYHQDRSTSKAEDIMDLSDTSNPILQEWQGKPNQGSEDEAKDCLDRWQPEIRTKSRDEKTSESAASFGYPERSLANHARAQLISALGSREAPPAKEETEGPEHSSSASGHIPLLPGLHGQSEQTEAQHTRGSSNPLANAGDRECHIPNTVIAKTERTDYAKDLMQSIRSKLLEVWGQLSSELTIFIPCNVRDFMEKQFAGSNENLGRVVTLSGTATCGQATTCRDYIHYNWPLRGLWLLGILQDAFDEAKGSTAGRNRDLQISSVAITTTSIIAVHFIGSREAAIDVVQLLVWFGAAFQVSSSDQLQYSQSNLNIAEKKDWRQPTYVTVDYGKSPVREESCWFSLFNNPVIAQGFPVPERSNSECGLELPIELMATLGGGRHAVDFEGGLVIKGHSIAFVPVKQYEDTIQWHMVSSSEGTRLRYSDLKMHRALQNEVDYESIRTKRAILGWSRVAQTFLGTTGLNYEGIDWSEAKEAGRSTRLSGGGLGFQSNIIGQLNFALGAKDGRLLLSHNGPLEKIIDLAEKTPVALYDHLDRRAWLVPALEVILHVIHTRASLNLYKFDGSQTKIYYSDGTLKISDQAARRAIMASKDQQLYEGTSPEKAYYVRDATLDIWSLLERMMERDAVITSAPGVAVRGTMRDKLYGWEFRALVEDKSSFRQKEQVLEKTNGGWVDLVDDTDAIVLFGNGFGEVIKPVFDSVDLCSAWKVLPKGRDYLAVGCPMLETLYNEAGSRKTRSYLTSRHLQWHRGSTVFERCGEVSGCACNRLQQLVYDSRATFRRVEPPDELPENGCVIFGRAKHPIFPAMGKCPKKPTIYNMPNGPLLEANHTEPERPAHLPTRSLESRPVMNETPDRNDSSSMFDRSSCSTTDSQSESELRMLSFRRRRKTRDQDAWERDSLNERQKKRALRRSSLQGTLVSTKKIISNGRSSLKGKDNNRVRLFPADDNDPLAQAPGRPCGSVTCDDYIHWQSHPTLETDSGDGKGVEMRHASMAVNSSK